MDHCTHVKRHRSPTNHRCDLLLSDISRCGSIFGVGAFTNAIDLLVHLCAVVVAHLTSPRYAILHPAWMPGPNTSNLPQAFVCLAWQLFCTPASSDTWYRVEHTGERLDVVILLYNYQIV